MVAPVWRIGQTERSIYFPQGRWPSYWDSNVEIFGPATETVSVPLDQIPVFIRDGAEVPLPSPQG